MTSYGTSRPICSSLTAFMAHCAGHDGLAPSLVLLDARLVLASGGFETAVADAISGGLAAVPKDDPRIADYARGDARGSSAEGAGASIDRVGQHVMNRRVDGQAPDDPVGGLGVAQGGQDNLLLPAPHQHLADRLKLGKLAEHQCHGLLHTLVRILLDTIVASLHIADRHGEEEFAPTRLLLHGFDRALPEDGKLHLAHRPLHAEQQPVIGRGRVIDGVLIDDQCPDQAAKLEERVPVAPVARQP